MNTKIISTFLVLTLASMACGFIVDLPKVSTAEPMVTDEIKVARSESHKTRLRLSFGAGHTLTFIVTNDVGTLALTN